MFLITLVQFLVCLPVDVATSAVDFDTQVMPILTKSGCNTGACHGAAAGRGGFFLSLYGSRPADDYDQIARAMEGRRVDSDQPELSLIVQKPTQQLSHEGGTRIDMDGPDYQTMLTWLNQGAKRLRQRQLRSFAVISGDFTVALAGTSFEVNQPIPLRATAEFDDGTSTSVIPWTVFTPNDPSAIDITADGVATVKRPGRHVVLARFLDRVAAVELLVPFGTADAESRPARSPDVQTNIDNNEASIDAFIDRKIQQLGLFAAPPASDNLLIRRLTLDLTGRLPTLVELEEFLASSAADKIEQLVDRLMHSDDFVEFWSYRLAGVLRVPENSPEAYYQWIRSCVRQQVPYDEMARQLLLAKGDLQTNGPSNFYPVGTRPAATAELASSVFLGIQLQCANCHDHPLDKWTQDDYHGMAAIFATVSRGPVLSDGNGFVIHPQTGEAAVAKLPGDRFLQDQAEQRQALAEWITTPDNPYFGKAIANRTWRYLMGRGLVEPIDDLRSTNPATHPELLQWLAADFSNHSYSLPHLIRTICLSKAYQRSRSFPAAPANGSPEDRATANGDVGAAALAQFYCISTTKLLSPPVFLDAVKDVCGAVTLPQDRNVSVAGYADSVRPSNQVGRCEKGEDCSLDQIAVKELAVQLKFINGDILNKLISADDGALQSAISSGTTPEELVDLFYRRAYCRLAGPDSIGPHEIGPHEIGPHEMGRKELEFWTGQFRSATTPEESTAVAEDFLWSLLTSEEFLTNH